MTISPESELRIPADNAPIVPEEEAVHSRTEDQAQLEVIETTLRQVTAQTKAAAAAAQTQQQQTISPLPKPKKTITVDSPDVATLETQSKGSIDDSKTWRATFFVRMIQKAFVLGWSVIFGGKKSNP